MLGKRKKYWIETVYTYRWWPFDRFLGPLIERNLDRLSSRNPKLAKFLGFAFLVPFAAFLLFGIPFILWSSWQTGTIKVFRRMAPDLIYTQTDNPIGFWLYFAQLAAGAIAVWGCIILLSWLFWSVRHFSRSFKKRTHPPLEELNGVESNTLILTKEEVVSSFGISKKP